MILVYHYVIYLPFVYRWEYLNNNSTMFSRMCYYIFNVVHKCIHNLQFIHVIILVVYCNVQYENGNKLMCGS
jgi:hypothetical protein